jgi:hypothetical protein
MASLRSLAAGLLLAQFLLSPAMADEVRSVEVNAMRNPELKPYKVMLAGLDAFDEYHALAPKAPEVRFKLRVSGAGDAAALENVALRIVGTESTVQVPVAADGLFVLPRIPALADDDADLVANQRKGNFRWGADVHSEGVPPDMRRLGDMRLECEVVIAVTKKEIPFWMHAMVTSLLLTNHWCGSDKINWSSYSARPLRRATLLAGEQRVELEVAKDGKGFTAPTSDTRYPDDTLIELKYADEAQ